MTAFPSPIAGRVAAIQARVAAFTPPPGFAGALAEAEAQRSEPEPKPPVKTEAAPPGSVVVGILGDPVQVAPGVSFPSAVRRAGGKYPLPPVPAVLSDWAAGLPERGQRWVGLIEQAAGGAGVDPRLLAAVTWAESAFRPDAVSHAGAIGLAQLMPGTAAGLGVDPWDPAQNLAGGARYLATQLARFGRVDLTLAAYNAGPGRVQRAGGIPNITETQNYVVRVLDYYARLGGTP